MFITSYKSGDKCPLCGEGNLEADNSAVDVLEFLTLECSECSLRITSRRQKGDSL